MEAKRELILKHCRSKYEELFMAREMTEDTPFHKVCLDQLDFLELVMGIEKETGKQIEDSDESSFATVKDFVDCVLPQI